MRHHLSDTGATLLNAFLPFLRGPRRAMRLVELATVMAGKGLRGDATALCLQAIAEAPADSEVAVHARALVGEGQPRYHVPLLNDPVRLDGFETALKAASPGKIVLDVGTGSGVLAMMAARAGAELVIACENDPALAMLATENVNRNGFADRVRVVCKDFHALRVGDDIPRRADVFVSDIEAREQIVRYAREHLLTDSAVTVPEAIETHVALAELCSEEFAPVGSVCGFDMRAFNLALGASHRVRPHVTIDVVSTAEMLFETDLSGRSVVGERAARAAVRVTRDARIRGVLQWSALRLAAGVTISSEPRSQLLSLRRQFYPLPTPLAVAAGQRVMLRGHQARGRILVWVDQVE